MVPTKGNAYYNIVLYDKHVEWAKIHLIRSSKGRTGTPWLPSPDSTDAERSLDRVQVLLILFSIQLAINALSALRSCAGYRKKTNSTVSFASEPSGSSIQSWFETDINFVAP